MTFSLVGSLGAYGTSTPAWGAGESRTAGNLLICWAVWTIHTAIPTISSGWSTAISDTNASSFMGSAIFYRIATGGDAAPTLTLGQSGQVLNGQLGEFSPGGNGIISIDQTGVAFSASTSPLVATAGGVDVANGELAVWATSIAYTASATKTISTSFNNGTAVDLSDGATNTGAHQANGYAITTANSSADAATATFTTTSIQGAITSLCSFKLIPATGNMALFMAN